MNKITSLNEKAEETVKRLKTLPLPDTETVSVDFIESGEIRTDELGYTVSGLPPLFRARLLSRPGKRSNIRIEVWMPEKWNGRFVGTGNGGIGGVLHIGSMGDFVKRGYACAHTDLGTSGGINCGYENDDIKEDYSGRATHMMTVCAKKLIFECYGKEPEYSYFSGSSTGGFQAYSEAQKYPCDYDGIYAGVPSIVNTAFHTHYLWSYVHLHKKDRTPMFNGEELHRLSVLSAKYLGEDGDCFVSRPYRGKETADGFLKYLETNAPELSEEQRAALKAVYYGPYDALNGKKICCGIPIGAELGMGAFTGDGCPGIYPFIWAFGDSFDPWSFDFSKDFEKFDALMGKYINATDPDLSDFRKGGGKLLAFAGTADTIVLYPELDKYYIRAASLAGGAEKCSEFFRYFLLPGRDHGWGMGADRISSPGKHGYDAFDALVRWREEGKEPDVLCAISSYDADVPEKKTFEREIYPYGSEKFPFGPCPDTYGDIVNEK